MSDRYEQVITRDGTPTFWSGRWSEHYHSREGALSEARAKFVRPSRLARRLAGGDVALLDVCFGLGYNTLAACAEAQHVRGGVLHVSALELDWDVVEAAAYGLSGHELPLPDWPLVLSALAATGHYGSDFFEIRMHWGDARVSIRELSGIFDLVFHDPFSTQRCAELWSVEFFALLRERMGLIGELYTYSEALAVRSGLVAAGLCVGATESIEEHRGGTVASVMSRSLRDPLPAGPLDEACDSRRGEPYRDPDLSWTNSQILADRERRMRARHA